MHAAVRHRPAGALLHRVDRELDVIAPHVGVGDHEDLGVVGAVQRVGDRVGLAPWPVVGDTEHELVCGAVAVLNVLERAGAVRAPRPPRDQDGDGHPVGAGSKISVSSPPGAADQK